LRTWPTLVTTRELVNSPFALCNASPRPVFITRKLAVIPLIAPPFLGLGFLSRDVGLLERLAQLSLQPSSVDTVTVRLQLTDEDLILDLEPISQHILRRS
jgi:hypothetical protein